METCAFHDLHDPETRCGLFVYILGKHRVTSSNSCVYTRVTPGEVAARSHAKGQTRREAWSRIQRLQWKKKLDAPQFSRQPAE